MSSAVRIAAVVEGPTDAIALEAILSAVFPNDELEFQTLQPEGSLAFGTTGSGWGGVYRWIGQAVQEGDGSISGCSVLDYHDLLVVQVDADVAHTTYQTANINDAPHDDLPCDQACPPASATTDALRAVILNWLGEDACPEAVVLCTPSKSIDTWILAAVCPDNGVVRRDDWECNLNPDGQFSALPKAVRFRKNVSDYRSRQSIVAKNWCTVAARLSEAARFKANLLSSMSSGVCRSGGSSSGP